MALEVGDFADLDERVRVHRREFDEKCEDGFGRLEVVEAALPDIQERIAHLESGVPLGEAIVAVLLDMLERMVEENREFLTEARDLLRSL